MTRKEQLKIADLYFAGDLIGISERDVPTYSGSDDLVIVEMFDQLLGRHYKMSYLRVPSGGTLTVRRDSIKVAKLQTFCVRMPTVFI